MSQMMVTGRRNAKSSIRSILPCGMMRSSVSSTICWMRGRMSSTRRAVKAFTTSPRRRVWSGGSCCSIQWLMLRNTGSSMILGP